MKKVFNKILQSEKNEILEMHKKHANLISEQDSFSPYATSMLDNPDYTTTTTTEKNTVDNGEVIPVKDIFKGEETPSLDTKDVENIDQKKLNSEIITTPEIVNLSKKYLGIPYLYGSKGDKKPMSFDCSGFIRFLLYKTGVLSGVDDFKTLPRTASGIKSSPNVIEIKEEENVKPKNVKPGDFVFFKSGSKISHIGLISNVDIENNKLHMVHASSSQGVQDTEKVYKEGFNKNSYWGPKIAGYGRLA
jgi:cell wall-associated NlpC family hydrolase